VVKLAAQTIHRKLSLNFNQFSFKTLKDILEAEIDRNGFEYPEINRVCEDILDQLNKKDRGVK